jgi:Flp pilus assembly protein protease CpaA
MNKCSTNFGKLDLVFIVKCRHKGDDAMPINIIACLILLLICSYTDIKSRTIYNWVLTVFFCLNVILIMFNFNTLSLSNMVIGLIVPIALLITFFLLNVLGAGDIKLLCVLGFFIGTKSIIYTCLYSILTGGIIAVIVLIIRFKTINGEIDHKIPFAPAVTIGYIMALLLK